MAKRFAVVMNPWNRSPTKLERALAIALSLTAASVSGAVAVLVGTERPASVPTIVFFTILFLASAAAFARAASTRSRKLSATELFFLSRLLVGLGVTGVVVAFFSSEGRQLMLLGAVCCASVSDCPKVIAAAVEACGRHCGGAGASSCGRSTTTFGSLRQYPPRVHAAKPSRSQRTSALASHNDQASIASS